MRKVVVVEKVVITGGQMLAISTALAKTGAAEARNAVAEAEARVRWSLGLAGELQRENEDLRRRLGDALAELESIKGPQEEP